MNMDSVVNGATSIVNTVAETLGGETKETPLVADLANKLKPTSRRGGGRAGSLLANSRNNVSQTSTRSLADSAIDVGKNILSMLPKTTTTSYGSRTKTSDNPQYRTAQENVANAENAYKSAQQDAFNAQNKLKIAEDNLDVFNKTMSLLESQTVADDYMRSYAADADNNEAFQTNRLYDPDYKTDLATRVLGPGGTMKNFTGTPEETVLRKRFAELPSSLGDDSNQYVEGLLDLNALTTSTKQLSMYKDLTGVIQEQLAELRKKNPELVADVEKLYKLKKMAAENASGIDTKYLVSRNPELANTSLYNLIKAAYPDADINGNIPLDVLTKMSDNELRKLENEILNAQTNLNAATIKESSAQKYLDKVRNVLNNTSRTTSTQVPTSINEARLEPVQLEQNKQTISAIVNSNATQEEKDLAVYNLTVLDNASRLVQTTSAVIESKGLENCTDAEIDAWIKATQIYNDKLKEAQKAVPILARTDFNKDYTRSIAMANDFDVNGKSYSEFATEKVVESPKIAAAMYRNKAMEYERYGNSRMAEVEREKAEIMLNDGFWNDLRRGFLQADNNVRNQFYKMAESNMRATYATYNNVLNNPEATEDQKAEAAAQISQANMLMTARTAMKYSTGILSGDKQTDGIYGVTDPSKMTGWQNFLAGFETTVRTVLGLGVSPAANKAYLDAFYLNNGNPLCQSDSDKDGFVLCQEYGYNATAEILGGVTEAMVGGVLFFVPGMSGNSTSLVIDGLNTIKNAVYGVNKAANESIAANEVILDYLDDVKRVAPQLEKRVVDVEEDLGLKSTIDVQDVFTPYIENDLHFKEGAGSTYAPNSKFNQALTTEEWAKLIEADPVMRNYIKGLV